jgi:hypothetical protein
MGSLILVMALVGVLPALATEDLNDSGLDWVSAAGQAPAGVQTAVVSTSGANSPIYFAPVTEDALTIAGGAQSNLRALVLNNVVGENQVANGINISNDSGVQSNYITQSVGAIKDIGAVQTSPGRVKVLSITADVILTTAGENSSVLYGPVSTYILTLGLAGEPGAQTDLTALVINNIAGNNQVAAGANVANLSALALSQGAGQGLVGSQLNLNGQFRGTPANFTR